MYTMEDIKNLIVPVPQQVTALNDQSLALNSSSKFSLTAPSAEKGPAKTAVETMRAFLTHTCGEGCFAPDGLPVTLELGTAPAEVKNEKEAYRIKVSAAGITITGFGESGLFYGVLSFRQMCRWTNNSAVIPAVEVLDWPDAPFRGYKEECRYGSNVMEREEWLAMIDDLAEKKINNLCIALYGCWGVQYDGRVAEYLYLPLKKYPQLKTPMAVKYWSPTENKWYDYETLPPIYRDNLFGELVRYAKERGIDVIPGINSLGHNTLFPRMLPEVAPKDEDGTPNPTGFCTSCDATYELLFSIYDQIIDEHLIPNEIYTFNVLLDEVNDGYGINPEDPYSLSHAWCKCPECRKKERSELFIEHSIKVLKHLKEKGMKSVLIAHDMLAGKQSKLGYIADKFMARIDEEGLRDTLLLNWWWYSDVREILDFHIMPDELGLRSFTAPWNGYHIWSLLGNAMRNIQIMAEISHNSKCCEGHYLYAMWDKSCDRTHDCFADYAWNFEGTGSIDDVTVRYAARHFAPIQDEAYHAFRLMNWITENRKPYHDPEAPSQGVLSTSGALIAMSYYRTCYFSEKEPYPRHFPGSLLNAAILPRRWDYERVIYSVAAMAKEALAIFEKAERTPGCDQEMAHRMAYECQNYQVLVEDWLAFLKIYDLTQSGDQKKIVPIARARQTARLALMERCEQTKDKFYVRAAGMRNHSVFMQTFADIADYIEHTDDPKLNLLDITDITSPELRNIR